MPKCDTETGKCAVFTGERSIKKGQQLFFHYRPWSNLQLLIRYGFAVPGNPWGPALTFKPLTEPPAWLMEAGCAAGPLQLRASKEDDGPPLPEDVARCARAAYVASVSDAASLDAEKKWAS